MRHQFASVVLAAAMLAAPAMAAPTVSIPRAVVADPARDASHPAVNRQVLILSHGEGMNALLMLASGAGPKPTMLLLHGLPGNEQNLDLAQAIRRAGWNVLTLHYRGSWGSPGRFSLAGAFDDVEVAMDFLRRPDNARQYGIDPARLVVAGHSMGGFLAARYAATHGDVLGAALIDPWNVGASGKAVLAKPEGRQDAIAAMGDDFGNSLAGTDAAQLMAEVERHARDWDLVDAAPQLARKPLLIVDAQYGNAAQVAPLAAAIRARGGPLKAVTLASDHGFADHRIALAGVTVGWLDGLTVPAAKAR
ncbi:S9 family peptidase [Herbaspirillum sp. SJZ107]|uniref:alpha/beta hydrolase family protein n=1 Tax=Herbaspirillum sp. SJZ107 TaxID=2572881 RepID=UPI001154171F|nr:alpha/beta fold hydrolase [Herbaspirillum sp. SJZ107]TQK07900.1 alpha/beta hydrolase family protein [Herbaspirillum sp. SJZ107]